MNYNSLTYNESVNLQAQCNNIQIFARGTWNWLPPEVELGRRNNLEKEDVFIMAMLLFFSVVMSIVVCKANDFSHADFEGTKEAK